MRACACVRACVHAYVYTFVCMYVRVYVRACVRTLAWTFILAKAERCPGMASPRASWMAVVEQSESGPNWLWKRPIDPSSAATCFR